MLFNIKGRDSDLEAGDTRKQTIQYQATEAGGTAGRNKTIKNEGKIDWGIGKEAWLKEPVPPKIDIGLRSVLLHSRFRIIMSIPNLFMSAPSQS
jgi:hypothetical protein